MPFNSNLFSSSKGYVMRQQLINSSSILIADFSRVCFSSFFPHNYTGTSSLTLRLIASFDGVNRISRVAKLMDCQ
ncbi:hypothetical protein T4B_8787 [Trichinella pseudospiralis]|uniref:Uncharacterized protein n=1 Tax=Trichinella pseudospiralis TaxID=6337 RepID=A0A0V1J2W0_TRIPS|nr:hypothetical protein T4B_8787 [Trichinella pseudospiralis]KRZ29264.1 hypothetical protein T4C_10793 [Trichinella pseudospiralis]